MKFKFKLEKVLQHRKTLEDIAQREFQEAEFVLRQHEQKLVDLHQGIVDARNNAYKLQSDGGQAGAGLVQVDGFIKGQEILIQRQKVKIQEAQAIVEQLRDVLKQKAIEFKIMEELREKKFEEYKEERRDRDQKLTDELNIMRYSKAD